MATIWKPSEQNELYHFGVIGMKWGVHKARKFAASGQTEKREATLSKIDAKATKKLQKINTRYEKRQARADRKFDKAERKSNSFLSSERSARKAFRKASKEQFRANKIALKGKKWYERMIKEYKKAGISMSKENQEIGKELVRQIRANSRAMYAANYAGGR